MDLVFCGLMVAFVALSIGLIVCCDKLGGSS